MRQKERRLLFLAIFLFIFIVPRFALATESDGNRKFYSAPAGFDGTISYGQTVSGSLAVGQVDSYTFSGTAGDKLMIRMVRPSGGSLRPKIELLGPGGTKIKDATSYGSTATLYSDQLSSTGTYTVKASDDTGQYSAAYTLALEKINPGIGPTLSYGSLVSGTLIFGDVAAYIFSGTTGDVIFIQLSKTTGTMFPDITLFGPDGKSIDDDYGAYQAFSGPIRLTSSGTYTVLAMDNYGYQTGDYVLSLERHNPDAAIPISYGEMATGNLPLGGLKIHKFQGTAFDILLMQVCKKAGTLKEPGMQLLNPDLTSNKRSSNYGTASRLETTGLPATGTYFILVRDYRGTGAGDYTLTLDPLNRSVGTAVTYGQRSSATLALGDLVPYTFTGTKGDVVFAYTWDDSNIMFELRLYGPDGTFLKTNLGWFSSDNFVTEPLPSTGTYTLIAQDYYGGGYKGTGVYAFSIERLNPGTGPSIASGQIKQGNFAGGGDTETYTFSGKSGDYIGVNLTLASDQSASFDLLDPAGTTLKSGGSGSRLIYGPLPSDGTYTILCWYGQQTGSDFSLSMHKFSLGTGPTIKYGQTVTGKYADSELQTYTFSGKTGDVIAINISTMYSGGRIKLYDPQGTGIETGSSSLLYRYGPFQGDGLFTLLSYRDSTSISDFVLTIDKVNPGSGPALSYGQKLSANFSGSLLQTYTFSGESGDFILVRMTILSSTEYGRFSLYDSLGAELKASDYWTNMIVYGPLAGDKIYTLVCYVTSGAVSNYILKMEKLNPGTGPAIKYGQIIWGSLSLGDLRAYTFSGNAGEVAVFGMSNKTGTARGGLRLFDPQGTELPDMDTDSSSMSFTSGPLPSTGTYTLLVYYSGTGFGEFKLTLRRPGEGFSIAYGETVSGTFKTGGTEEFDFSGKAGDVAVVSKSFKYIPGSLDVQMKDPQGNTLPDKDDDNAIFTSGPLPSTGIYKLILKATAGSGVYALTLERGNPGTGQTIGFGKTVTKFLDIGDMDSYIFSGTSGGSIKIDMLRAGGWLPLWIKLYRPNGTELKEAKGDWDLELKADSLPDTGLYTLIIFGSNVGGDPGGWGNEAGTYTLTLLGMGGNFLDIIEQPNSYFVGPGAEVEWTSVYGNATDKNATAVIVEAHLAPGLSLVDGSISGGGIFDSVARKIQWNIGSLPLGDKDHAVGFRTIVSPTASLEDEFSVTATISSQEFSSNSFSASVHILAPEITSVSPSAGGNTGQARVAIYGRNLDRRADVKLLKTGETDIVATGVEGTAEGTTLTATFNLRDKTLGSWNLAVVNPGGFSATLVNGFSIEQGGVPKLWVDVIGRNRVRLVRGEAYQFKYGNAGGVDPSLGFLEVQIPSGVGCRYVTNDQGETIWDNSQHATIPLYFVTSPVGPGEERSLTVKLEVLQGNVGDKLKYIFKAKSVAEVSRFSFGYSLFSDLWNAKFPGEANRYFWEWATAFGESWQSIVAGSPGKVYRLDAWMSLVKDKMLAYLQDDGLTEAAEKLTRLLQNVNYASGVRAQNGGSLKDEIDGDPSNKPFPRGPCDPDEEPEDEPNSPDKEHESEIVNSCDPNDKQGPPGYDPAGTAPASRKRYIGAAVQDFFYKVEFENLETATAATQDMKITDQLSTNLDWTTFSFGSITIGTHVIALPEGCRSYNALVDFRPEMDVLVQVVCSYDEIRGTAQWIFRGTNRTTGDFEDFLPPNTAAVDPKGRGFVTFKVRPKPNLAAGTTIRNKARIDFEIDIPPAPLDTPEWLNTIDDTRPASQVTKLGGTQTTAAFNVQWGGTDGESGIYGYAIYVSDNGQPYTAWQIDTAGTSAVYPGVNGHTYSFYSVAIDNAGNVEPRPAAADTTTTVNVVITPEIRVSRTALVFGGVKDGTATQTQTVLITSPGTWTATPSAAWIQVTPATGTGTGAFNVSAIPGTLAAGAYAGTISIADPIATNTPVAIQVTMNIYTPGAGRAPFGDFATPLDGTTGITGAIPVTGWVLDDVEVTEVDIKRDPYAGDPVEAIGPDGLVFVGYGIFVEGARPDVESTYSTYPLNYRAGWGYMLLTNFLPAQGNGTFRIHAFAIDKEGNKVLLGSKTITCDNAHAVKPFGTIDTPAQGGNASGNPSLNFGWVLTPLPKTVPKDGSTIEVYVDSVKLGNLATAPNVYNQYREDVARAFPGLNNTSGPVGAFFLNTTALTNGVHTIFWIATDDAGAADGIGSRYFNIVNTGTAAADATGNLSSLRVPGFSTASHREERSDLATSTIETLSNLLPSFDPLAVKRGFDMTAPPETMIPDNFGSIHIEMKEVERVEIELGGNPDSSATMSEAPRYEGYLRVGDILRPLPLGSTLDPSTGRFSWLPGPGFIGSYDLVFLKTDGFGITRRISIRVMIRPKYE